MRICAAPNCENELPKGCRPTRKTCSDNCRSRLAGANKSARLRGVDVAADGAVAATVQEAVREYVNREVLTSDLLLEVKKMVGLTPSAISAMERLLSSDDDEIAMRAAQSILRYTMGNPSVAPPPLEQAPSPMTVTFNLPRAGDATTQPDIPAETRMCGDCHVAKPASDFVAGSARCQACFDTIQDGVRAKLAP